MALARTFPIFVLAAALAGCSATASSLEPIPGSITYNGQPRTKLSKSPIGSTFGHKFRDPYGDEYLETYRIRPDRTLEIVSRHRIDIVLEPR
jgi:hypothetical protein